MKLLRLLALGLLLWLPIVWTPARADSFYPSSAFMGAQVQPKTNGVAVQTAIGGPFATKTEFQAYTNGAGGASSSATVNFNPFRLLVTGDSISTANVGQTDTNLTFPAIMARRYGYTVLTNAAVPGVSAYALNDVQLPLAVSMGYAPAQSSRRTVQTWLGGKNDCYNMTADNDANTGTNAKMISVSYRQATAVELAAEMGFDLVMITMPWTPVSASQPAYAEYWRVHETLRASALTLTNRGVIVVDFDAVMPPSSTTNADGSVNTAVLPDGLHPSATVNSNLALAVDAAISNQLKSQVFLSPKTGFHFAATNASGFTILDVPVESGMITNTGGNTEFKMGGLSPLYGDHWYRTKTSWAGNTSSNFPILGVSYYNIRDSYDTGTWGGWGFRWLNNAGTVMPLYVDTSGGSVNIGMKSTQKVMPTFCLNSALPLRILSGDATSYGNGSLQDTNATRLENEGGKFHIITGAGLGPSGYASQAYGGVFSMILDGFYATNFYAKGGGFYGNGAGLTNLDASQLGTGIVPMNRLAIGPTNSTSGMLRGSYFTDGTNRWTSRDGGIFTNLSVNASNIVSGGQVPLAAIIPDSPIAGALLNVGADSAVHQATNASVKGSMTAASFGNSTFGGVGATNGTITKLNGTLTLGANSGAQDVSILCDTGSGKSVSLNGAFYFGNSTMSGQGVDRIAIGNSSGNSFFGVASSADASGGGDTKMSRAGVGVWLVDNSLRTRGSGTFTNGVILPPQLISPGTPTSGALLWSDGTNLCATIKSAGGTITTNKVTLTAWP